MNGGLFIRFKPGVAEGCSVFCGRNAAMGEAAGRTIRARPERICAAYRPAGMSWNDHRGRAAIRMKQRERNRMALREEADAGMRTG